MILEMNRTIIGCLMAVVLAFSASSCTDLEEDIFSDIPKDGFFTSEEQLVIYSARAYTKLQAWGSEQSLWTLNIQLSDELAAPKNSVNDWVDPRYKELQTHNIPSSNKLVRQGWDYCFDGIAACNDVIYEIEKSPIEFDGKSMVLAEMKVLRAFFYFCAVDCWGNVPYSVSKIEKDYPEQKDRRFMFDFLEKEILENVDALSPKAGPEFYGRITQGVAYTLLAKLYLNAEQWIGRPEWEKAEDACEKVIGSHQYSIENDYKANFRVHNESSKEAIFAIPYSTVYTQSDHNDFVIFILTLSPVMCKAFNIPAAGWDGFIGQPDFLATYEEGDIRKKATWLYGQQYDSKGQPIDGYVISEEYDEDNYSSERPETSGARVGKWEYQTDGLLTSDQTSMENDFFVFRYADVVLMYVEALVRQGRDDEALMLEDFKKIRTRAGLEPMTYITLESLLLERSHELALEGWKRQDQIRFGTYGRRWWAKPDEDKPYMNLLPIPRERLNANPKLTQNPGYSK